MTVSFGLVGRITVQMPFSPDNKHLYNPVATDRQTFLKTCSSSKTNLFDLQASKLGKVNYAQFNGPEEHIPARAVVFAIIDEANFDSPAFSHAQVRLQTIKLLS